MVKEEFFFNCTSPQSLCTTPEPIFGAVHGVCNTVTQLCECPPGYNGEDMFAAHNDCHIKVDQRLGIEIASLSVVGALVVATVLGVIRLLFHWGIIYWKSDVDLELPQKRVDTAGDYSPRIVVNPDTIALASEVPSLPSPSGSGPKRRRTIQDLMPSLDIGELQSPRPNARTNTFQQLVSERKRRRNTLTLVCIWFIFAVSTVVYMVHRVLGYRIEEQKPVMFFSLATTMWSVVAGLWMITYTWFSNLPSLRMFATMFPKVPGIFVCKHPTVLRAWMTLNLISINICSYVVLFIFPMISSSNINPKFWTYVMAILAVHIFNFALTHCVLSLVLLRLFWALQTTGTTTSAATPTSGKREKKVSRGEQTVRLISGLTLFFGPTFTAFIAFMAIHPAALRYSYFFFAVLVCGGGFSGLVSTYVFVFRMGSKVRVRKNSSAASNHSPGPVSKKSFKRGSVESVHSPILGPLAE